MYLNSSSGNRHPQQQLKNSFYKIHMDSQLFFVALHHHFERKKVEVCQFQEEVNQVVVFVARCVISYPVTSLERKEYRRMRSVSADVT